MVSVNLQGKITKIIAKKTYLDLAIYGNGFFVIQDPVNNNIYLTRDGQFKNSIKGLQNKYGHLLLGRYEIENESSDSSIEIAPLQLINVDYYDQTKKINFHMNLNANQTPIQYKTIEHGRALSFCDEEGLNCNLNYHHEQQHTVITNFGDEILLGTKFAKIAPNKWAVEVNYKECLSDNSKKVFDENQILAYGYIEFNYDGSLKFVSPNLKEITATFQDGNIMHPIKINFGMANEPTNEIYFSNSIDAIYKMAQRKINCANKDKEYLKINAGCLVYSNNHFFSIYDNKGNQIKFDTSFKQVDINVWNIALYPINEHYKYFDTSYGINMSPITDGNIYFEGLNIIYSDIIPTSDNIDTNKLPAIIVDSHRNPIAIIGSDKDSNLTKIYSFDDLDNESKETLNLLIKPNDRIEFTENDEVFRWLFSQEIDIKKVSGLGIIYYEYMPANDVFNVEDLPLAVIKRSNLELIGFIAPDKGGNIIHITSFESFNIIKFNQKLNYLFSKTAKISINESNDLIEWINSKNLLYDPNKDGTIKKVDSSLSRMQAILNDGSHIDIKINFDNINSDNNNEPRLFTTTNLVSGKRDGITQLNYNYFCEKISNNPNMAYETLSKQTKCLSNEIINDYRVSDHDGFIAKKLKLYSIKSNADIIVTIDMCLNINKNDKSCSSVSSKDFKLAEIVIANPVNISSLLPTKFNNIFELQNLTPNLILTSLIEKDKSQGKILENAKEDIQDITPYLNQEYIQILYLKNDHNYVDDYNYRAIHSKIDSQLLSMVVHDNDQKIQTLDSGFFIIRCDYDDENFYLVRSFQQAIPNMLKDKNGCYMLGFKQNDNSKNSVNLAISKTLSSDYMDNLVPIKWDNIYYDFKPTTSILMDHSIVISGDTEIDKSYSKYSDLNNIASGNKTSDFYPMIASVYDSMALGHALFFGIKNTGTNSVNIEIIDLDHNQLTGNRYIGKQIVNSEINFYETNGLPIKYNLYIQDLTLFGPIIWPENSLTTELKIDWGTNEGYGENFPPSQVKNTKGLKLIKYHKNFLKQQPQSNGHSVKPFKDIKIDETGKITALFSNNDIDKIHKDEILEKVIYQIPIIMLEDTSGLLFSEIGHGYLYTEKAGSITMHYPNYENAGIILLGHTEIPYL